MALLPVDVAPSDSGLLNVRPVTRLSRPAAYSGRSMIGTHAAARKRTRHRARAPGAGRAAR